MHSAPAPRLTVIVSASYKTDIPALFGEWFRRRLDAGYCFGLNAYNNTPFFVPLGRPGADAMVFWTRNAAPFLPVLDQIASRGLPFTVQYTLTGYPRELERALPPMARAVATLREIARRYGPAVAVWRYDPVLMTTATPPEFHTAQFASLAQELEGAADEVVISFAQIYQRTRRNLERVGRAHGLAWRDPDAAAKRDLAAQLAATARRHGMRLTVCSQPEFTGGETGAAPARCVDVHRLSTIAQRPITAPQRGNRPGCECFAARDIGAYDTCTHGCVYCYAVREPRTASANLARHDPSGEFLLPPSPRILAAARKILAAGAVAALGITSTMACEKESDPAAPGPPGLRAQS